MIKKIGLFWILIFLISASATPVFGDEFTQKDREVLVELKVKMGEIDKRFEQIDKRFEQIDKRFEQIDKRFEQIDKQFEQVDHRFSDLISFLWMIVGIFTAITVSTIGFALWDRRTMIRPFEKKIKELEESKIDKIDKITASLRTLAKTDTKLAEVLKEYNLL
jgi:predicted PurR-regulated permease PerM